MKNRISIIIGMSALLSACSSHVKTTSENLQPTPQQVAVNAPKLGTGTPTDAIPLAVIYRTSSDCAELVPVNLTPDKKGILSYPAPSDLTPQSVPLKLSDGWFLDRRGIGPNTVFTSYTYNNYRNLKQAPTPDEILDHLTPDCRIEMIVRLPVTQSEACSNTSLCEKYIADNLQKCDTLFRSF